jgi:3-oxoacyl-[acyl-carrier protein] reductase
MTINLTGKSVLITGGSRGIGTACVRYFAKAGADIAFTFNKSFKESELLVEELSGTTKIKAYAADLDDPGSVNLVAANIIKDFNGIDILVNNGGIWEYGQVEEMSVDEWERTMRINMTSAFIFTKSVTPQMKVNKYGKIINISSTAGQRGEAFHSHYAASKGALISFTKSLATELGKFNINVNSVAPGWVLTDMCTDVFSDEEYKEKVRLEIPVQRIATPEDIAGPVLFLASEMARHINGEILNVNGGSVLCG